MKVYSVGTGQRPKDRRFKNFAPLVLASRRTGPEFVGLPFGRGWKPLKLEISMPLWPKPDFWNFGVDSFICNERAVALAGEPLERSAELLPVTVKGLQESLCIVNVTNCVEALDAEKSSWEAIQPAGRILRKPAFFPSKLGEESLFKITETAGWAIYCLERTGDPDDGEFKAIVEKEGLTGLVFKEVWSDSRQKR